MFKVLANAWKIEDIRKKILYTLMILLLFRLGCYVPVPGVNVAYISQQVENLSMLGFLNMFSGGALGKMTVFAMGITPYINASIIINLLTIAVPALERISKEEDGRKKIGQITRYVGIGIAFVQSIGILIPMGEAAVQSTDIFNYATIILCLTAGSALVMWLGEQIDKKGIGNGISLIIFAGILSRLPATTVAFIQGVSLGTTTIWAVLGVVVAVLIIITGITYVDLGERRIPVQYAKRVVGRKQYGGQSSFIPMKINQSGVMPIIFAMTLINFPMMIAEFWPQSAFYLWYKAYLGTGTWIYAVIYALLILFFSYFYAQVAFNPIDVSKNLQQYGGFIPGIRPGKPTSDYMAKILSRITLFSAFFLAVIAAVPTLLNTMAGISTGFAATSLLIMVSVALEVNRQLESQIMMRHYKGFL